MEFALLGPVEVQVNLAVEAQVDLGPARQRAVLVALLVDAGRPVPVDRLAERVWGRRVPPSARRTLFSYLSRLRSAGVPIERRPAGYVVGESSVDIARFRDLVARARSTEDLGLYDEALGLWRGEPFAGLDSPWLAEVRHTLLAERQAAELDRTDLALCRGRHTELLAGLASRCAAHPLDERLAGQYLSALHASGRTADAVAHYQRLRQRLADELGIDPGGALQRCYQQILTGGPPRQLPAPPGSFTGRAAELGRLTPGGVWLVSGTGGIGKTWLALRWAHDHLDRFPDGQLYIDLRGFDPARQPASAEVVLRGFLHALGVAAIPADVDAQAGLYRTLTADRHMLVVLDNARDAAQVTPLLPGGSTTTVLVTSRHQLGLPDARRIVLDVLSDAEARTMFGARPVDADLLGLCAGLPLALGIVAARAADRPDFPLAAFADELRADPLDDVRAVFSWSLRALDADAVAAFGLLGLMPGPDISAAAALALTGRPRAVLRQLEKANLLHQHVPGRYRMHDLVRLYAAEQVSDEAALRRLVDFYLHTAFAGDRILAPYRTRISLDPPTTAPEQFDNAATWFAAEHACLLAAQQLAVEQGWHTAAWQLAWVMSEFHWRNGLLLDQRAVWQIGLASAERAGHRVAQHFAHRVLGMVSGMLGEHTAALAQLERSLDFADDDVLLAHSRMAQARVLAFQDEFTEALARARQALDVYDVPVWQAMAHNAVGWYLTQLGDRDEGRVHLRIALDLFREHNHPEGEAGILAALGDYDPALAIFRRLGNVYDEAITLEQLGRSLGPGDQARAALERARDLYLAQHRTSKAVAVREILDQW